MLVLLLLIIGTIIWALTCSNFLSSPSHIKVLIDRRINAWSGQSQKSVPTNQPDEKTDLVRKSPASLSPNTKVRTEAPLSTDTEFNVKANNLKAIQNLQQVLQDILSLNKESTQKKNLSSYHNQLGLLYAQIGDFSDAISEFDQSISICHQQLQAKPYSNAAKQIKKPALPVKKTIKTLAPAERAVIYIQLECARTSLARIYDKLGNKEKADYEIDELNNEILFAADATAQNAHVSAKQMIAESTTNSSNGNLSKRGKMTDAEAAIFAHAEALRQTGHLNEAVAEYVKLTKMNPSLAIPHQRLGLAAVSDNNLSLAINELETAAKLGSNDADTQNDLGLVYRQIGDYASAKEAFARAHKIDPKHLSAAVNLSNMLASSNNYKSAVSIMSQAVKDHPNSALAHNNLASLIARSNNQTAAAKEFAKAINLEPALASAHYGLGIALLKLKAYPAAIKEFKTAITLNPGILDLQNKIDIANRCNLRTLNYEHHRTN